LITWSDFHPAKELGLPSSYERDGLSRAVRLNRVISCFFFIFTFRFVCALWPFGDLFRGFRLIRPTLLRARIRPGMANRKVDRKSGE
jgi:hypothetical protein